MGVAVAGSPITVGIDRSRSTPSGRSAGGTGAGRTYVNACRRPSRPIVSQATRLAVLPLISEVTKRCASGPLRPSPNVVVPCSIRSMPWAHSTRRPAAQAPRIALCPASCQKTGLPGNREAAKELRSRASLPSPTASPPSTATTPVAAATPSSGFAPIGPGSGSSASPDWRSVSTTAAVARPAGTASGIRASRPPSPSRRSTALEPAVATARMPAPTPVVPARQAPCRAMDRRSDSSCLVGIRRIVATPTGTAARSATRTPRPARVSSDTDAGRGRRGAMTDPRYCKPSCVTTVIR